MIHVRIYKYMNLEASTCTSTHCRLSRSQESRDDRDGNFLRLACLVIVVVVALFVDHHVLVSRMFFLLHVLNHGYIFDGRHFQYSMLVDCALYRWLGIMAARVASFLATLTSKQSSNRLFFNKGGSIPGRDDGQNSDERSWTDVRTAARRQLDGGPHSSETIQPLPNSEQGRKKAIILWLQASFYIGECFISIGSKTSTKTHLSAHKVSHAPQIEK